MVMIGGMYTISACPQDVQAGKMPGPGAQADLHHEVAHRLPLQTMTVFLLHPHFYRLRDRLCRN
jgi:hypothetical protein